MNNYVEKIRRGDSLTNFHDVELRETVDNINGELTTDTTTIEGNPLNFTTLSAQTAKSTILSVEPIQDLHGYDKPWIGGAGKNKLPMTVDGIKALNTSGTWNNNEYTFANIVYTLVLDNDNNVVGIKTSGTTTSSGTSNLILGSITNANSLILNGCPNGGATATYKLRVGTTGGSFIGEDIGSGYTFTANEERVIAINFGNSTSGNGLTFYPMVRLSTESDATFAPYTNECPISGRTEIGILGCGKNLLPNIYAGKIDTNTGEETTGTNSISPFVPVEQETSYVISNMANTSHSLRIFKYDASQNYIGSDLLNVGSDTSYVFIIDSYTHYIRFQANNEKLIVGTSQQIEKGSIATPYEPYTKSNDLTISLGQTVYGGTLDVENGVLVVTKKIRELTNTDTWYHDERWDNCFHTVWTNDGITPTTYGIEAISSQYTNVIKSVTSLNNGEFVYNTAFISSASGSFIAKNEKYSTVNEFKDSLVNNPIQLCYELATPITIQLTPHQISLLKSVNNISTTGDKITLTYRDGSVATLSDLTSAVDSLDGKIEDSKILTDTATGDKYILVVSNGVLSVEQVSN